MKRIGYKGLCWLLTLLSLACLFGCAGEGSPTPSIAQPQQTVDFVKGENAVIEIKGRHDPCVVHRAVPVIEAAAALAACQLLEGEISL